MSTKNKEALHQLPFNRRNFVRNRLGVAIALAHALPLGGLVMPVAMAQEPLMLEEVLVTARRKEENMQEVPIAITAFSNEALREKNIVQMDDLRTNVPSLGVSVGGSSTNAPIISLRGQRPAEVLLTLDPAVPLYFAEVGLSPTQGTNLSIYDLENVQVLKGPQGTLFGRNSTGGAVLFTPKRPGDELGGYLEVQGGEYNLGGVEGAIDVPLGDTAALRVGGKYLKRDGYQDNLADNNLASKEEFWDEDSKAVRVSLRFSPTESFENLSIFDWSKNDAKARVPTPLAFNPSGAGGCQICPVTNTFFNSGANEGLIDDALARQSGRDWNEIETDLDGRDEVENTFFANTTTWDINDDLTLKNIFGYRDMEQTFHQDTDGTWLPMFGTITEGDQNSIGVTTPSSALQSKVDATQYSDELQLLGVSFDNQLDWIVGAYWSNMDGSQTGPTQILPIVPQNSPNGDADNTAYGAFAEGTWGFNDQWAMTLGARQSWDEREVTVSNTRRNSCLVEDPGNPGTFLPDDQCSRKEDEDFDKPTFRGVLNWTPTVTSMAYGSVSTGYRTGGFNLRGTNDVTLAPFEEETVTNYEIGYKADWNIGEGAMLRTNFAVYYQDYEDIQKTQATLGPDGTFGTNTINIAEATISGFEADLLFSPIDSLTLTLSYSYIDAEYDEWDEYDEATDSFVDRSYRDFTWIPESSLTSGARWELPVNENLGVIALSVHYYYQDEVAVATDQTPYDIPGVNNAQLNDTIYEDSYQVWDLRMDWLEVAQSDFDLAVWGRNLGDEEYGVGGLNVLDSLGWASNVYGAPRTWGASVRYRF